MTGTSGRTAGPGEPGGDVVRLLAIREDPLSVDEVLAAVAEPGSGGTVVFVGTVRDSDDGKGVAALGYSAHPSVEGALREVAERVASAHPVRALAAVHRVGDLAVGDLAVVVAVACPHRGDAFAAARMLIDDLKAQVPIWKHQRFEDGSQEWVGLP
jgi:molybdopterin synthase catalytic subunit